MDADTFGGMSPQQMFEAMGAIATRSVQEALQRGPDPRHDLTTGEQGTVVSVDADGTVVQLDADAGGAIVHCAPASVSPQQRVTVLASPSGAAVIVGAAGGSSSAAPSGPVQIAPATVYQPIAAASVARAGNAVIKAVWSYLGGGPWVAFAIDFLYGTTTFAIPTFVLPVAPAPRRHAFNGVFNVQPSGSPFDLTVESDLAGGLPLLIWVHSSGSAFLPTGAVLTDIQPAVVRGPNSRVVITGIYEAAQ